MTVKLNVTNEGLKYGVILGLVATLIMYGTWAMGIDLFVKVNTWVNFIPYMVITLIIVGLNLRKQNDNVLSFQEGIKFTFLTYVIVAVITAIATYILYNVIDPELSERSFKIGIEKSRAMLEKLGMSEDKIDEALQKAKAENPRTDFKKIFLGSGLFLIWDFVKSILITLVIKREKKIDFETADNI